MRNVFGYLYPKVQEAKNGRQNYNQIDKITKATTMTCIVAVKTSCGGFFAGKILAKCLSEIWPTHRGNLAGSFSLRVYQRKIEHLA